MTEKNAMVVWKALRSRHLDAVIRHLDAGSLSGENVVEVGPKPALSHEDFAAIMLLAETRNVTVGYGQSPRRVLVLA